MATNTPSAQLSTVFNLSTTGHGNYDRSWEDYIDYTPDKGIVFSSHDYTYGWPVERKDIRPLSDMPADMQRQARQAVIDILQVEERIFDPGMWIGTSTHRNYNMPCRVVRSRKFRGQATLINIVSKRDIYNREMYKALIVGEDNLKYYVSPGCIKPDKAQIIRILEKCLLRNFSKYWTKPATGTGTWDGTTVICSPSPELLLAMPILLAASTSAPKSGAGR